MILAGGELRYWRITKSSEKRFRRRSSDVLYATTPNRIGYLGVNLRQIVCFLLVTFLYTSKEKWLACRATPDGFDCKIQTREIIPQNIPSPLNACAQDSGCRATPDDLEFKTKIKKVKYQNMTLPLKLYAQKTAIQIPLHSRWPSTKFCKKKLTPPPLNPH